MTVITPTSLAGSIGEKQPTGQASWLITFADLLSLLLTFFVMLFAMMTLQPERWHEAAASLSDTFRPIAVDPTIRRPPLPVHSVAPRPGSDLDYLTSVLQQTLAADPQLAAATVIRVPGRLVLELPADLLFAPGDARLTEAATRTLAALVPVLNSVANAIAVHGHADPEPLDQRLYPSNWELSLARAAAVAAVLDEAGLKKSVTVRGFGESRYSSVSAGDIAQTRALARRVDLVIETEEANAQ